MTFTMEEGVIRRMRSVFRKKEEKEEEKPAEAAGTEWVAIRTILMRVLRNFPEARAAVVEGLAVLTGGGEMEWAT